MKRGRLTAAVAVRLRVPLVADRVLSPAVRWGSLDVQRGPNSRDQVTNALVFPLDDDGLGRVTFEGLDAVRVSRGEYLPYERADGEYESWEWVYVIRPSAWLRERHDYETRCYETQLVGPHDHYLFRFHDEFVEAIASGIWLDRPDAADPFGVPDEHPLAELGDAAMVEEGSSFGIGWKLRVSPLTADELVERSAVCSQRIIQYDVVLDGRTSEHASVWLRTRDGLTTSSLTTGFFPSTIAQVRGVAATTSFAREWEGLLKGIAERRRERGLQ